VKQLEKENTEIRRERDHVTDKMTNQKRDHDMKVKLLEKEKDDVRKERDAIKEQLSKLKAEYDMKVKEMEREKTEIIETNEKQVKQLEELKNAIQHTTSALRFITAPEKGKSCLEQFRGKCDNMMMLAKNVMQSEII